MTDYVIANNNNSPLNIVGTDLSDTVTVNSNADGSISTGGGDDTVSLNGNNTVTVDTGDGADTVTSKSNEHVTINTGSGDDIVNLNGNGDATVDLGAGNDTLTLLSTNQRGNNGATEVLSLTGGDGSDTFTLDSHEAATFHFSFNVQTTQGQTVYFRDGDTPNQKNADGQAWANYAKQLDAWRDAMEAQYGADQNAGTTLSVDAVTSTKKTSLTTHYDFDNSFTFGGGTTITSTDGHDTIKGFNVLTDKLDLGGITQQQFDDFFTLTLADADGDGTADDTVIALKGGGFQLDLIDVQLTSAQLAHATGWDLSI